MEGDSSVYQVKPACSYGAELSSLAMSGLEISAPPPLPPL